MFFSAVYNTYKGHSKSPGGLKDTSCWSGDNPHKLLQAITDCSYLDFGQWAEGFVFINLFLYIFLSPKVKAVEEASTQDYIWNKMTFKM